MSWGALDRVDGLAAGGQPSRLKPSPANLRLADEALRFVRSSAPLACTFPALTAGPS